MTENQIDCVLNSIDKWFDNNATILEEEFKYVGFNAVSMRSRIIKLKKEDDVNNMIMFCMMRGTNTGEKLRISRKGHDKIKQSIASLDIRITTGAEDITVSRLCCCFPEKCATMLKLRPDFIKAHIESSDLPSYLCFPQGASLIDTDDSAMYGEWMTWANGFDELINKDPKKRNVKTQEYWNASWKSNIFDNAQRKEIRDNLSYRVKQSVEEINNMYLKCQEHADLSIAIEDLMFANGLKFLNPEVENREDYRVLCVKTKYDVKAYRCLNRENGSSILAYKISTGTVHNFHGRVNLSKVTSIHP